MKDVSNSANIKTKKNIRTYIFESVMLILKSIKLGFIGFLSLLVWILHLTGSGINIIKEMIPNDKNKQIKFKKYKR